MTGPKTPAAGGLVALREALEAMLISDNMESRAKAREALAAPSAQATEGAVLPVGLEAVTGRWSCTECKHDHLGASGCMRAQFGEGQYNYVVCNCAAQPPAAGAESNHRHGDFQSL